MIIPGTTLTFKEIEIGLANNIDSLCDYLGIEYYNDRYIHSACPVHGGDNPGGFAINTDWGRWRCFTHGCHEIFKPTLIGLIQGRLSHERLGWISEGDRKFSIWGAADRGRQIIAGQYNKGHNARPPPRLRANRYWGIPREIVLQSLDIPAQPFIDRGLSPEILKKFDIGVCRNPRKYLYNRVVVPCYEPGGDFLEGVTARSIFKQCNLCKYYHDTNQRCPNSPKEYVRCGKWVHSGGFNTEFNLYNLYRSSDFIKKTRRVILVESVCNVIKLEQNGILGSVATFGCKLTGSQTSLLDMYNVKDVIVAYDPDEAGRIGAQNCLRKYGDIYNIKIVDLPTNNDIADMSDHDVKKTFKEI